jgi:cell wall-associated NlpC family hydrolase
MPSTGVVLDSVANLFSQPSLTADLVTQAVLGSGLTIKESKAGWYDVELPDRYQGWIEARNVRVYAEGQAAYASSGQVAQVTSLIAFLYHQPAVSLRLPALQATLGCRLEVAQEMEDWIQVALPAGPARWMKRGDVELVQPGAAPVRGSVEEVIATAKRFLGLPYLWGGCTPLGIDCSGFVQLAWGLHGVQLLRDADIQFTQPDLGVVGRDDLEAGDLVFFGGERITHVGLYMGDGQFIHATTHQWPVVQISGLDEVHWVERYRGGRRP